jgi:DNA-binding NtrC family response regulator
MKKVLVVDDEKNILTTLARALSMEGYEVAVAGGGKVALEKVATWLPDVVLLDVKMPDLDGLEVLAKIKGNAEAAGTPSPAVVMMSGHGTIETAVKATRAGASDFVEKPVSMDRLLVALGNAFELVRLADENRRLRDDASSRFRLVGDSTAMKILKETIALAAPKNAGVLILGESGTGKELIAHAIHAGSARASKPFVKMNCAAVSAELVESELFVHEKGSFTGAVKARAGRFEQADGGTLFIDEVGDMPMAMQAKLLRVLQEGEFERVGGDVVIKVDVRVIAATNKDLQLERDQKRFREDLYHRLYKIPIQAPPLRARKDDLPALILHFVTLAANENAMKPKAITPDALSMLTAHDWPGNVRELRNTVERLLILTPGAEIDADAVRAMLEPAGARRSGGSAWIGGPLRDQVAAAEREIVLACLEKNRWHVSNTARELELERSHLYKKMRALGIERESSSTEE